MRNVGCANNWCMAQTWNDLLFLHWPVDTDWLRQRVPPPLQVDTFDGQAYLGVIAFRLSNIHLRGWPVLPVLDVFAELNVRTYVTFDGRPGVLFLSLHCPNRLAIGIARPWFHLPYHHAPCTLRRRDTARQFDAPFFSARYEPIGPSAGALETWLTERYCYYAVTTAAVYRCDVQHRPWQLSGAVAHIRSDVFGAGAPLAHLAERMDALIWPPRRVRSLRAPGCAPASRGQATPRRATPAAARPAD